MPEGPPVGRVVFALGLLLALIGLLLCWPLTRTLLTHERGQARILELYRTPQADGRIALRAIWEVEVSPGRWLLGDQQRNQFFRPIDDPVLAPDEVETVATRVLPDRNGRQNSVKAFWRKNDPDATAFIIDVSETHPWRRYILGLAACGLGLITARIAWATSRRRSA